VKCSECGKAIHLVPSAQERARRFGGVPSDYSYLFGTHTACLLQKRDRETRELIARHYA
jgi:hypothetical protein